MLKNNRIFKLFGAVIVMFVIATVVLFWQGMHSSIDMGGKPKSQKLPQFSLQDTISNKQFSDKDINNTVNIMHVWATWCGVCVREHQEWISIKEKWNLPVIGVIYRDDSKDAMDILHDKGNPYIALLDDNSGRFGLGLGLTGTPETFVVDRRGVIRWHHVGPLTEKEFATDILPIVNQLQVG